MPKCTANRSIDISMCCPHKENSISGGSSSSYCSRTAAWGALYRNVDRNSTVISLLVGISAISNRRVHGVSSPRIALARFASPAFDRTTQCIQHGIATLILKTRRHLIAAVESGSNCSHSCCDNANVSGSKGCWATSSWCRISSSISVSKYNLQNENRANVKKIMFNTGRPAQDGMY
ncbi:hypothetical protein E3N88_24876 [Mikania micrantha]|uniref:Uncharacterized protein n=1 Tax=Mikania micrantha TaxID=192012 RepID=A0A5N6N615_9ASTR|nr:hypothetical protein E3N88_24876 [Mikania micrantha]